MSKTIHLSIDIRGFLRAGKREWLSWGCRDADSGRLLTADEIFDELTSALARGEKFMPTCKCDNFDPQKGCLGHESTRPVRRGLTAASKPE